MRKTLICLAVVAVACGGDSGGDTTAATTTPPATTTQQTSAAPTTEGSASPTTTAAPGTTTTAPEPPTTTVAGAQPAIRIDEIVFAGEPYLLIANRGDGAGSTAGHFICRFPDYFPLPAVELQPGERLAVPLGEGEVPDLVGVVETVAVTSPLGPISSRDGELGLYSTNQFSSSEAIVDYVEWGSSGHARSDVAVGAGIWTAGGFVAVPDEILAIVAQAFPTQGPDDWFAEIGG